MLNTTTSCEIGDLIDAVAAYTGKSYDECESAAFKEYIYPEGYKTSISVDSTETDIDWFRRTTRTIMAEQGIAHMYITEAI
jgi:hypothetical protein